MFRFCVWTSHSALPTVTGILRLHQELVSHSLIPRAVFLHAWIILVCVCDGVCFGTRQRDTWELSIKALLIR